MQLRFEGPVIKLYNEMTLKDLERTLKSSGEAKSSVEFFDQDGSRIAYSSKVKHVLELPNFKMNIDVAMQYHCHSVQGFSESISAQTPEERDLYNQFKQYNLKDIKARSLAKFVSSFNRGIHNAPVDRTWTPEEVAMLLRDAMAVRAQSVNINEHALLSEMEMIEEAMAPLRDEIDKCKEKSNISSQRAAWAFTGIICMQFALSQYGTYYALSWDIIEPITACVSLSDAIAAYFFWLWAGKPWDLQALRQHFYDRKKAKMFRKRDVNFARYQSLLQVKATIKNKMYHR